jgi:hypothetical protein
VDGTHTPPNVDQNPLVQVTRKSPDAEYPLPQPSTHVAPDAADALHEPTVT